MEWPVEWAGDGTRELWIQGLTDALGWGMLGALLFLVPLLAVLSTAIRRRRFWCAQSRRDVVVEFEVRGFPGFRRPVDVRSCSVFDPPSAVRCRRRCLDGDFRRQWDTTQPVRMRNGS